MRLIFSLAMPLAVAAVIQAAPLPEALPLSDKYLLDDADMLAVINVKQALASPLFKKSYEKMVTDFLKEEPAASMLKEAAFDPLKDLDRIYGMGRSPRSKEKPGAESQLLVLQGRFDVAKLQALAEKVQKDGLLKIDIEKYGDSKVYRISGKGFPGPLYAAVLDKTHVGAASNKNTIEDALDKAAGKKKTALKIKALAEMFAKFKGDESLAVLATADAIIGGAKGKLNPDGTQEIEGALRDQGVEALQVTVNVGDAIKGRTTLTVKDAATAAKIEEGIKGGIKQGITELEKMKEYPALLKALKTVKVAVKDQTVTMEGEGDGEAVQQFFVALLVPRTKVKPGPSTNPTKP